MGSLSNLFVIQQAILCAFLLILASPTAHSSLPSLSDHPSYGAKHSNEYSAMYDICGVRSDGKVLNCPYTRPSVKPDSNFSAKIQSLCPSITGNVCCIQTQFDTLREQVQQIIPFLVGCPACLRNFLNLFCELSCSPNQSLFINVTSTAKVSIAYHVTLVFSSLLNTLVLFSLTVLTISIDIIY